MKLIGFRVSTKTRKSAQKNAPRPQGGWPPRRRRRRRFPWRILLGVLLAVLVLGGLQLLGKKQPDAKLRYVGDIPVHEDFLPEGMVARPGDKRQILYVVMHETDNTRAGANAQAHNSFIHNNGAHSELSWHYTVDEREIWHHLPDDEVAFHAGDRMEEGGGNKNGIGIEMCVNEDGDFEKTLQNAQKLAGTLLYEYGLTIDALKKHEDFSGKCCPFELITEGRWEEFQQGVQDELQRMQQQDAADTE